MFGNVVRVTAITTTTTAASTKLFVECIEECVIMNHLTFMGNYLHNMPYPWGTRSRLTVVGGMAFGSSWTGVNIICQCLGVLFQTC
jgi:hypothetical protein